MEVSIEKLFELNAHLGHQASRWNPKMGKFLYGTEGGVHLFDLTKTKVLLEEALTYLQKQLALGKKVILVTTKKQLEEKMIAVADALHQPYVRERWLGGTLTNFNQIKRSIDKLAEMKKTKADGGYLQYTKKERVLLDREAARLERVVGGLSSLSALPDILFVLNLKENKGAAIEARRLGIYTVGICDSNTDPDLVDLAIPMSDDAADAIFYVLDLLVESTTKTEKPVKKASKSIKKVVKATK
jgi:small subunit ribosomal protein S2